MKNLAIIGLILAAVIGFCTGCGRHLDGVYVASGQGVLMRLEFKGDQVTHSSGDRQWIGRYWINDEDKTIRICPIGGTEFGAYIQPDGSIQVDKFTYRKQ
jgi:hypothetical protein